MGMAFMIIVDRFIDSVLKVKAERNFRGWTSQIDGI